MNSGGISGAAKKIEGWQDRHAESFYEEIRHRSTDIKMIAANTIFTEKAVSEIKEHIFFKEHDLGGGKTWASKVK